VDLEAKANAALNAFYILTGEYQPDFSYLLLPLLLTFFDDDEARQAREARSKGKKGGRHGGGGGGGGGNGQWRDGALDGGETVVGEGRGAGGTPGRGGGGGGGGGGGMLPGEAIGLEDLGKVLAMFQEITVNTVPTATHTGGGSQGSKGSGGGGNRALGMSAAAVEAGAGTIEHTETKTKTSGGGGDRARRCAAWAFAELAHRDPDLMEHLEDLGGGSPGNEGNSQSNTPGRMGGSSLTQRLSEGDFSHADAYSRAATGGAGGDQEWRWWMVEHWIVKGMVGSLQLPALLYIWDMCVLDDGPDRRPALDLRDAEQGGYSSSKNNNSTSPLSSPNASPAARRFVESKGSPGNTAGSGGDGWLEGFGNFICDILMLLREPLLEAERLQEVLAVTHNAENTLAIKTVELRHMSEDRYQPNQPPEGGKDGEGGGGMVIHSAKSLQRAPSKPSRSDLLRLPGRLAELLRKAGINTNAARIGGDTPRGLRDPQGAALDRLEEQAGGGGGRRMSLLGAGGGAVRRKHSTMLGLMGAVGGRGAGGGAGGGEEEEGERAGEESPETLARAAYVACAQGDDLELGTLISRGVSVHELFDDDVHELPLSVQTLLATLQTALDLAVDGSMLRVAAQSGYPATVRRRTSI
jgi:hypothetical protein